MSVHRDFLNKLDIATGLMGFLWQQKLWWMIPAVAVLLLFAILIVVGTTSGLGPFVYPLF